MDTGLSIIGEHIRLTARLFLRFGAPITAVWAIGGLLDQLLLRLAVEIGQFTRIGGVVAIAAVVLVQLLVFVAIFLILRNGLPNLRLRRARPKDAGTETKGQAAASAGFALMLLAALIPFYGYYAGWGFLNEKLRSYSQLFFETQMRRMDYDNPAPAVGALELNQSLSLVLAVGLIWAIRRFAKSRNKGQGASVWPLVVVACEATWAFIGLYVISGWKDEFAAWLARLPRPDEVFGWLISAAGAAITSVDVMPVDWPPPQTPWEFLVRLFWYALLPLVWFNLGAIVYGHSLTNMRSETQTFAGDAVKRWNALPKAVQDFIDHFWGGLVRRWHAVANGVLLAASAGIVLTGSVLVLWRFIDWLGAWAWIGATDVIGPQPQFLGGLLSLPLSILFGAPGGAVGGLLVSPLQFCILAAGLELAGRAQTRAAAEVTGPAARQA